MSPAHPLRPTLRVELLVLLVALYVVAAGNGAWWHAVTAGRPWDAPSTWLFAAACFTALVALNFVLLVVLAGRWTVKPLLALIVLVTAAAAAFMRSYAVMLDSTMMRNVLRTDLHEVRELLSWSLAWSVVLWSAPPLLLLWRVRIAPRPWPHAIAIRVLCILAAAGVAAAALLPISRDLTAMVRNQRELRYLITPANVLVGLARNAVTDASIAPGPRRVVGADAHRVIRAGAAERPRVLVLVLGETARAASFSLLGYARQTNPELARLDVVALSDVQSCGTSTEVSVPCMFSRDGRAHYDEARIRHSEGVLHVLARAGVAVQWRDNQSGCKGVCAGANIDYRKLKADFAPGLCRDGECYDEILVESLREEIAAVQRDTVIVLHMMGNHGPAYHRRYPPAFRRFVPDCQTAQLRDCSRAEVVNAYDNAILYTDHVLADIVRTLDVASTRLDTAMLYVSDHGESLGEGGLYLHGLPYRIAPAVQTQVPMLLWLSSDFAASAAIDVTCLHAQAALPRSHDSLFDSLLGALQVETVDYRAGLDLFSACRSRPGSEPVALATRVAATSL